MSAKKILLALSLLGILLLLSMARFIQPVPLEKSSPVSAGEKVFAAGIIKSINYREKFISLHLQTRETEFIIFETHIPELKVNQSVQISGRVDSWQNKTQVLVDKITLLH